MFPDEPVLEEDESKSLELPKTMHAYLDFTKPVHRFHFVSLYETQIYCNITLNCGHVVPLPEKQILSNL
jgi:hypothetical protein